MYMRIYTICTRKKRSYILILILKSQTDLKKAVALHFPRLGSETGIYSLQSATSRNNIDN